MQVTCCLSHTTAWPREDVAQTARARTKRHSQGLGKHNKPLIIIVSPRKPVVPLLSLESPALRLPPGSFLSCWLSEPCCGHLKHQEWSLRLGTRLLFTHKWPSHRAAAGETGCCGASAETFRSTRGAFPPADRGVRVYPANPQKPFPLFCIFVFFKHE